jgi:iron complex transport system ATP-binding protein
VVALLGPNGAGKSTLLKVAAGLLEPTAGVVSCFGRNLAEVDRRALARSVALVSQNQSPATGFRVREVVAMGRAPHQGGWMREGPEDGPAVERALVRCDLVDHARLPVETLSGGEQRRVALARALAQEPRVLLLDEPSAFFDVRHRVALGALIRDLANHDGLAVLIAMHDLEEAARIASRVLLLRNGRTILDGPPEDAMTPALLREAFDADVDVGVHAQSGQRYFLPRVRAPAG